MLANSHQSSSRHRKNKFMSHLVLTSLASAVCQIAREAGDVIMDIYEHASDIDIQSKADDSPLTIADRQANTLICAQLEKLDPKFPIISEENKAVPYEERSHYAYYWLVDPLDGTKEFIKRNGEFTVNIALVHDGRPILGVVYAPVLQEMYWAAKDQGAYLEGRTGKQPIASPAFQLGDEGLNIVCSRSHLNEATQAFVDQFKQPNLVPKGSSLKFLLVASGAAHLYPRLGPTMEWDTAAAQIILEEAGGAVIDEQTKAPLQYNKEVLRNPNFIAYGNVVH